MRLAWLMILMVMLLLMMMMMMMMIMMMMMMTTMMTMALFVRGCCWVLAHACARGPGPTRILV